MIAPTFSYNVVTLFTSTFSYNVVTLFTSYFEEGKAVSINQTQSFNDEEEAVVCAVSCLRCTRDGGDGLDIVCVPLTWGFLFLYSPCI